jgi:hypothetical protein
MVEIDNGRKWSSQDLVEILSTEFVSSLELLRAQSAEMTVTTCAIVEENRCNRPRR